MACRIAGVEPDAEDICQRRSRGVGGSLDPADEDIAWASDDSWGSFGLLLGRWGDRPEIRVFAEEEFPSPGGTAVWSRTGVSASDYDAAKAVLFAERLRLVRDDRLPGI